MPMLGQSRPRKVRWRAVGAAADRRGDRLDALAAQRALRKLDDLHAFADKLAHVPVLLRTVSFAVPSPYFSFMSFSICSIVFMRWSKDAAIWSRMM